MKLRNRIAAAALSAVMAAGLFYAPLPGGFDGVSVVADAATTVATPKASLKSGTYNTSKAKTVKLSCSTKGAVIWYSVNGGSYKKYTKAITISKNTTIKFYAKSGNTKSKVVTVSYKLTPKVTVTPDAGSYDSAKTVRLSSPVKGVKFYYTLDGSKPTTKSKLYNTAGIKVDSKCTLRVLAVKTGWSNYYITKEYDITDTSSILFSYKDKYYYQQLNASEKKLYKILFDTIQGYSKYVDIPADTYTLDRLDYVFELMRFENPQFFYIDDNYTYYYYEKNGLTYINGFEPAYRWNKVEGEKMQKQIEASAKQILNKITDKTDLFGSVVTIHDELVNRTDYNDSGDKRTMCAYGPLVYGDAICCGYAQAFCYLCQSIGIQCVDVNGKTAGNSDVYHEWNRLKLNDEWYNMDVTFDDPQGYKNLYHSYFCVTDAVLSLDHTIESWFPFSSKTKAVSTEFNYFAANGLDYYIDVQSAYDAIVEISSNEYLSGNYSTTYYCSPLIISELYDKLDNYFDDAAKYSAYPYEYNASYNEDTLTFTLG
ncbi:MAG: chitobiase/beta-hexosaminidase C-terminal domain-containing protein [Oscillospiraceae bacterium]|nr:chitobiase/beta-hexosaminidase C-terminal domain-containing protein [Oscillospiraceae bacterium]